MPIKEFEVGKLYYTTNKDGWSLFNKIYLSSQSFVSSLKQNEVFLVLEKPKKDKYKILLNSTMYYLGVNSDYYYLFFDIQTKIL